MSERKLPGILILLGLVKLLVHLPAMQQYGIFRDELYYLASTAHLDMGYVDHPPLSIAILAVIRGLLGDSLIAVRIVPALDGVAMVVVTGLMARELGGGRFAQALAAVAAIAVPVYLAVHHYYSMNCFDELFWTLAAYVLIKALKSGRDVHWALLGVILGLGLLNKISVLWLGAGLAAGLLLTPHRALLTRRGPWLAGAIAAVLFLPYIIWQILHGWPTLEFMRNAAERKMASVGFGGFLWSQVLTMNPGTAPIWLAGLAWCLFSREGRPWRILAWIYLTAFAILVASGTSRASYLAPAYTILLASGSVAIERLTQAAAWRRGIRSTAVALVVSVGIIVAPFALPVLPPDLFLRYMAAIGITPRAEERGARAELPQQYADMFGWDEMARKVAAAYRRLSPQEQARCAFFGQNYGEAAALEVLGPGHGLPEGRTLSGHNSYWLWGPRGLEPEVMIVLGGDREDNEQAFEKLDQVDTIECARCMPYERGLEVYVGRRLKRPLAELWPELKMYI